MTSAAQSHRWPEEGLTRVPYWVYSDRALYEEEPSLLGGLSSALAHLRRLAEIDPAARPLAEKAAQAAEVLQDAALELRDYREGAEADPARLETVEGRLALYERLARKHGATAAQLAEKLEELRAEAAELSGSEGTVRDAGERSRRLRAEYLAAARALSSGRREAAERLAAALEKELATLAMAPCEVGFEIRSEEPPEGAPLREAGLDHAELRVSPNPGEPLRPLTEIASGGELSRVMLAVNGALGARRRPRTLIFDEVDVGIGGRVATVVGEKLRALAATHQVIVITHLPQIASLADRHFVAEKRLERGRTVALVRELDGEARVAEIARMLGGRQESPAARRHAAEMLRKPGGRSERRSP